MEDYQEFLARKSMVAAPCGFDPQLPMPPAMKQFQRDITRWACRRGKAAIFEGTGLGKTLQQLAWSRQVADYTSGQVLILAPLAVAAQTVREAVKFGIASVAYAADEDHIASDIVVTNYDRRHLFDLSQFAGIVLDECFAAGTQIDVIDQYGNVYQKCIEDIRIGDYIVNASGVDRVADVHRREVPCAVKVSVGGRSIVSSPNHPFFTQTGWKGGVDLEPGDKIMATAAAVRMVPGNVRTKMCPGSQNEVLRSILLSEMADETAGALGKSPYPRDCSAARREEICMVQIGEARGRNGIGKDSGAQSDVRSEMSGEGIPHIESDGPRSFRAWGEWSSDDRSASGFEGCSVRELESGICFVTGPTEAGISHALQDRLSQYREQNSHRSGWSLPPIQKSTGREENGDVDFVRVDGIEILELGHPELDKLRDADGKLYFYDIGATQHPSFSVNGLLVHNSSIIKSNDGKTRGELMIAASDVPYKLCCTATPAPNDWTELGQHAEFLGVMTAKEMLSMFFVHEGSCRANEDQDEWRLKDHAAKDFWRWVSSWAVVVKSPNDLGYDEPGYVLPPLHIHHVTVPVEYRPTAGMLFPLEAKTMAERREVKRDTIIDRVKIAADLVNSKPDESWLVWCDLNHEGELLAKAIHGALEVAGRHSTEIKTDRLLGFCNGSPRVLVTKPKVASFGMNWQHCANMVFVGLNDSFEQFFQSVRRCWRFGQLRPVNVYMVASELEGAVVANLCRKERIHNLMSLAMIDYMKSFSEHEIRGGRQAVSTYEPKVRMTLPSWLSA